MEHQRIEVHHFLHIGGADLVVPDLLHKILNKLIQQENLLMSVKQEILDAVAAEKAQVKAKLDAVAQQIADLQAQLASGEAITPSDLAEIKTAIDDIYTTPA